LAWAAGSAYVFERAASGWVETQKLVPADNALGDNFGIAVSLRRGSALIGAYADDDPLANAGSAYAWPLPETGCFSLHADAGSISLAQGGAQVLLLDAGSELAGSPYLLLGTTIGVSPGVWIDGVVLPLNVDAYTVLGLLAPNQPPLTGSLGTLDAQGRAQAAFALGAGSSPSLAGLTLHHAYVALRAAPGVRQVVFASDAVALELLP
jgi:hypothetical protein